MRSSGETLIVYILEKNLIILMIEQININWREAL